MKKPVCRNANKALCAYFTSGHRPGQVGFVERTGFGIFLTAKLKRVYKLYLTLNDENSPVACPHSSRDSSTRALNGPRFTVRKNDSSCSFDPSATASTVS
jgi:hypothetical protein